MPSHRTGTPPSQRRWGPDCFTQDWFKEGDLGFISCLSRCGQNLADSELCVALADGGKCGPWQVLGNWPVLYLDGKMSYDDDKSRLSGLSNQIPEELYVLNHEVLFNCLTSTNWS